MSPIVHRMLALVAQAEQDRQAISRIVFTIPTEYAEEMRRNSGEFYLDVFGGVRNRETAEKIGEWAEIEPGPIPNRVWRGNA